MSYEPSNKHRGIGYANSEANVFTGNGTSYPNLPIALVDAGLIVTPAYSLWLDDLEASTGSILFGGIDTKKFTGDMQSVKVYPNSNSGNVTSFTVAFTSLKATSSSGSDLLTPSDFAEPAILDSGTTLTLLPDDIAQMLFEDLGAVNEEQLGVVVVPCTLGDNSGKLEFGFGGASGPVIAVPVSELVLPLTLPNGRTPKFENGDDACQLGIQPAGDLPILFGDTFLRSAYVVYDLANNMIGLAQTDFNATGSNVVQFASMGAPIPSAAAATGQVGVSQTETGIPRVAESTAAADGTGVVPNSAATSTGGLNAADGFAHNVGAAGHLEPRWATLLISGWLVVMVVGGGVFTLV